MKTLAKSLAVSYAFSWHGGQSSPLYSFASCGGVVHSEDHRRDLLLEVEKCLLWTNDWMKAAKALGKSVREYQKEPHRLMRLRAFINQAPVAKKETQPC